MRKFYATIKIDIEDVGCLPILVHNQIEVIERRLNADPPIVSPENAAVYAVYLRQLRTCLQAIEKARQQPTMVTSRRMRK